jgi:hypothetical protein
VCRARAAWVRIFFTCADARMDNRGSFCLLVLIAFFGIALTPVFFITPVIVA